MTTNLPRESAQIYQFPARGRLAAAAGYRDSSDSVMNLTSSRLGKIVSGGAWYHEAAIQDAEAGRKI